MNYRTIPGTDTIGWANEPPAMLEAEAGLIGSQLRAALQAGNRAQVWYQIRYGSLRRKSTEKGLMQFLNFRFELTTSKAAACAWLLAFMLPAHATINLATNDCSKNHPNFSGIANLSYANVKGDSGTKIYIHKDYPSKCGGSESDDACNSGPYLIPGDVVAIGKTCGPWSFVQFLGTNKVTSGWVGTQDLAVASENDGGLASGADQKKKLFTFFITKGLSLPVCQAYLQRLNQTNYEEAPPYCDRPENTKVPGFALLQRIPLQADEKVRLSGFLYQQWYRPNPLLSNNNEDPNADSGVTAWRYKPPIDIYNNGQPEHIIVWRGSGISGGVACGTTWKNDSWGYRQRQLPLILKADDKTVDVRRTRTYFQGQGEPSLIASRVLPKDAEFPFRPIGHSIGIFEYQGRIYMDAFFDITGDQLGRRKGTPALANVLGVFKHENSATEQVCEYEMHGAAYPLVDRGD